MDTGSSRTASSPTTSLPRIASATGTTALPALPTDDAGRHLVCHTGKWLVRELSLPLAVSRTVANTKQQPRDEISISVRSL
eukprot:3874641-Prymnesium_polylepis.2